MSLRGNKTRGISGLAEGPLVSQRTVPYEVRWPVATQLCYTIHSTLGYQDTKILTLCNLKALAPASMPNGYNSTNINPLSYTVKMV